VYKNLERSVHNISEGTVPAFI